MCKTVNMKLKISVDEIRAALSFTGFMNEKDEYDEEKVVNGPYKLNESTLVAIGKNEAGGKVEVSFTALPHGAFFEVFVEELNDCFELEDEQVLEICNTGLLELRWEDVIYELKFDRDHICTCSGCCDNCKH